MVTIKAKRLNSLKEKTIGLIGVDNSYPVTFRTRFGIHTFGLKFPIDVLIIDKENRIVRLKLNLLPNRIFIWNPRFDRVIELPSGILSKEKLLINKKVNLEIIDS